MRDGNFQITENLVIQAGNPQRGSDQFAINQLIEEFDSLMAFKPVVTGDENRPERIVVGLLSDPIVKNFASSQGIFPGDMIIPEGYIVSIGSNGILLAGADDAGTYYAVQTMKQLLRADRKGGGDLLPKVRIDDWPSFRFRGITDDVSRGPVPTMETIKMNLRRLGELKINKFNFYIEHVFDFKKHPVIGPEGGSFTAEQLKEIEAYASMHHIELVGGLQSFGHFYHILKHSQYSNLAELYYDPHVLTPAREESYELLSDMYSEIAPAFSSDLFNISCDETAGLGLGQSRRMVEKKGLEWVYAYHINKVYKLLKQYDKRVMMWADIALKHKGILSMLPDDLIFLPWNYNPKDNFDDMLVPISQTGHDFIVCPGVNCWGRIFPNLKKAMPNIGNFARDGARYNAWGVLNTTWDDDGENLFGFNWYPLAWGAEASWNPLTHDEERFEDSFSKDFYAVPGNEVIKAIRYLKKIDSLFDYSDLRDSAYWEWPVKTSYPNNNSSVNEAKRALEYSDKAEELIARAQGLAVSNKENIEYIKFSINRLQDLSRRRISFYRAARLYADAIEHQYDDTEKVEPALMKIDLLLSKTQQGIRETWKQYQNIWMKENREYWLDKNADKYKNLESRIQETRDKIKISINNHKQNRDLLDLSEVGLQALNY